MCQDNLEPLTGELASNEADATAGRMHLYPDKWPDHHTPLLAESSQTSRSRDGNLTIIRAGVASLHPMIDLSRRSAPASEPAPSGAPLSATGHSTGQALASLTPRQVR